MSTATTITPKEAADLWGEAGYLAYNENSYGYGDTVDDLSAERLASGAVSDAFIKAYEASKHIDIADMPPYYEDERENPWNALNDCLIANEFPEGTDMKAIHAAYAWVEAWKER